jgi:hypothetical protein
MTLSIKGLYLTLSTSTLCIMLNVAFLFIAMLIVVVLIGVMLIVIMQIEVMLNVAFYLLLC